MRGALSHIFTVAVLGPVGSKIKQGPGCLPVPKLLQWKSWEETRKSLGMGEDCCETGNYQKRVAVQSARWRFSPEHGWVKPWHPITENARVPISWAQ